MEMNSILWMSTRVAGISLQKRFSSNIACFGLFIDTLIFSRVISILERVLSQLYLSMEVIGVQVDVLIWSYCKSNGLLVRLFPSSIIFKMMMPIWCFLFFLILCSISWCWLLIWKRDCKKHVFYDKTVGLENNVVIIEVIALSKLSPWNWLRLIHWHCSFIFCKLASRTIGLATLSKRQ